jgi:lipid II:glycine glycyltransferase (peptidoglycan interpeptide bridge formation enzyme)
MTVLAEFLDRTWWGIVSVTFPDWVVDFQPFVWRGFKVIVRYTYQIQLIGQADEDLMANMNSSRRNEIRNGHKKELIVTPCNDLSAVYNLAEKTFRRQGVSNAMEKTRALMGCYANPSNSFAYVTCKAGMPVAACFCIFDEKRAYYVIGGVDDEHGVAAASSMALFACIKHARDVGLEVFDFEGSMVPGIEKYFRSFGGTLTTLHRIVKASLPIEMMLKPFKRSLF